MPRAEHRAFIIDLKLVVIWIMPSISAPLNINLSISLWGMKKHSNSIGVSLSPAPEFSNCCIWPQSRTCRPLRHRLRRKASVVLRLNRKRAFRLWLQPRRLDGSSEAQAPYGGARPSPWVCGSRLRVLLVASSFNPSQLRICYRCRNHHALQFQGDHHIGNKVMAW